MTPSVEKMVESMLTNNGRIVIMAALQEVTPGSDDWQLRVGITPGLRALDNETLRDIIVALNDGVLKGLSMPLDDLTLLWNDAT